MNYARIYKNIIERAKQQQRDKKQGYFERHHILPKSIGGTNSKENLVLLTAKEHYIAHMLLVEMYEKGSYEWQKMIFAASMFLAKSKNHKRINTSARFYQQVKIALSELKTGIPRSEETKAKMRKTKAQNPRTVSQEERLVSSKRMTGKGNPMYGKTHTEDVKKYLRELKLGKKNQAVSESNRRRTGIATEKTRAVRQIDKQGNEVNNYISIAEAKRQTGIKSIIGVLHGRWLHAGGYRWEYLEYNN
jgi:hypothetical protein